MKGKFGKKKSTVGAVEIFKKGNISLNNDAEVAVINDNITTSLPSLSIPAVNFSSEVTDKVIKSLKKLELPHLKELVEGSGIDPEVLRVNKIMSFVTLPGELNDAHSYLNTYGNGDNVNANGTLRKNVADKYWNLDLGGWWVSGIAVTFNGSVFAQDEIEWGQFKPNTPRQYTKKDEKDHEHIWFDLELINPKLGEVLSPKKKVIKYEFPIGEAARLMLLSPSEQSFRAYVAKFSDKDKLNIAKGLNYRATREFWKFVAKTNMPIIICEGAKKALKLLSHGYAAISVAGIYGGYRNHETRIWELRKLHKDFHAFMVNHREWYFCFDGESKPHVKHNIEVAITRTGDLIKKQNGKNTIRVIELPAPKLWGEKTGVDDFIVKEGIGEFDKLFYNAPTLLEWKSVSTELLTKSLDPEKSLHLTKEDLTYSESMGRHYLPEDLFRKIPQEEQFIGLKAPMGSGKTHSFRFLVGDTLKLGGAPLLITHRVQLGQALAEKLGVHYLSEIQNEDERTQALNGGLGLCIDSLHATSKLRFHPYEWQRPCVIIDEVEQVVQHLIFSKTSVKNNRDLIIRNLGELLKNCLNSGMRIVVADAHLTDISLRFLRGIIQEASGQDIEPFIVTADEFYLLGDGERLCHYYQHTQPVAWFENLLLHIQKEGGAYVCTDGQRVDAQYGTQALGKTLKERFPHLRVLVIDSETTQDPAHPAFGIMDRLNEEIINWDIVITSPSVGTGISIDVRGHFKAVFGRFSGMVTPKQAVQQLGRVREDIPRHVFAATRGLQEISGGSTSIKLIKAHEEFKYGEIVQQLKSSGNFIYDEESEKHMGGSCTALDTYCELALRSNAGNKGYRDFVMTALKNEGYEIIEPDDLDGDRKKELKDEIKQNKEELNLEDTVLKLSADIAIAEDKIQKLTHEDKEIAIVNREGVKKLKDERKIDKYQQEKLNIIARYNTTSLSEELINLDKDGMYNDLRLRYWFNEGGEFLADRDFKVLDKALTFGRGFKPDMNRDVISPKVKKLHELGIEFLFEKKLIHNEDEELRNWVSDLKEKNLVEVKALTGLSIGNMESPVEVVRKIYKMFGYKLNAVKRSGRKDAFGKRHIFYEILDKYQNYGGEILNRWLTLDKKNSLEKKVTKICLENGKRVDPPTDEELALLKLSTASEVADYLAWCEKYEYAA